MDERRRSPRAKTAIETKDYTTVTLLPEESRPLPTQVPQNAPRRAVSPSARAETARDNAKLVVRPTFAAGRLGQRINAAGVVLWPTTVLPATVAAAATTTTTTTVAAAAARLAGFRLVHIQGAAVVFFFVEAADGLLSSVIVGHFDKTEALAAAGISILNDFGAVDFAERSKQLFQT